jgi:Transposase DDE domain group 1
MPTQCIQDSFAFGSVEGRAVVADFGGGAITSDAGALLLGKADSAVGLIGRFAACFRDGRAPELIEHSMRTLVSQRVIGIALGYEDLVDHDRFRHDPVMGVLMGKLTPRRKECAALAGKSTLSRLEHAPQEGPALAPPRYHKISHDGSAIEHLFVNIAMESQARPPRVMVIDLDATDSPLHGHQEGRFFHGYYDCYCYLPLFVFWDRHLLAARLRPANIDAAAGSVEEVARIVAQIRARWPKTTIVLRADSGFCRDELMSWCEANDVHFVLGLARNDRLVGEIASELNQAQAAADATGHAARVFKDFSWTTRASWSRRRRVIAKAEWTHGEANPRFIVTSLPTDTVDAATLYERIYCQRGEMENRIKECQLDLLAGRMPTATMRANQLRLWFAAMAYVLMCALRRIALTGTELARATCGTIRLKLLKIGAQVTVSARRVRIAMATACPSRTIFAIAHARL